MPTASSKNAQYRDRIVLFGGSAHTLHLLQLALIRSDNVLLVGSRIDKVIQDHARRMGVEHLPQADGADWRGIATVLVADGRHDIENGIVDETQFRCIPVYVADRPVVSDFTLLDFLERRSATLARRGA